MRMSKVVGYQNVKIRSILGRFLEHSRIYNFHNDGAPEYLIGSADIMGRNLDRRIETLVSLNNETHKNELAYILDKTFSDEFAHWSMDENDKWIYVSKDLAGVKLKDFQEHFLERYQND